MGCAEVLEPQHRTRFGVGNGGPGEGGGVALRVSLFFELAGGCSATPKEGCCDCAHLLLRDQYPALQAMNRTTSAQAASFTTNCSKPAALRGGCLIICLPHWSLLPRARSGDAGISIGDGCDCANFVRCLGSEPLLPHLCPLSVLWVGVCGVYSESP